MYAALAYFLLATPMASAAIVGTTYLTLPPYQPLYARSISPDFFGFSLEFSEWPYWAGQAVGQPNTFVLQALANLKERTGRTPPIRVGGSSEDYGRLNANVQIGNASYPNATASTPYPQASAVSIGRDWYALAGNLPSDTKFVWGVAIRPPTSRNETINQLKELVRVFQGDRRSVLSGQSLEYLQLGNEPNGWTADWAAAFGAGWSPQNYTKYWLDTAAAVLPYVQLNTNGGTSLLPSGFSGTLNQPPFTNQYLLGSGLLDDKRVSGNITSINFHKYSGFRSTAETLAAPGTLQSKNNIFQNWTSYSVDANYVHTYGKKVIFGETNSYANHGLPNLSNTAEAAIWGVSYLLEGAALGVDRLYFHNGYGYVYNALSPGTNVSDGLNYNRQHIGPLYYATLVAAEAIGSSGNTYVAELTSTNNTISGYGIWENKRLARLVLTNHDTYNVNGTVVNATRSSQLVNLKSFGLVDVNIGTATIKSLYIPYTNAQRNITWAGQNFDTASGKAEGIVKESYLTSNIIDVEANSVHLICFK